MFSNFGFFSGGSISNRCLAAISPTSKLPWILQAPSNDPHVLASISLAPLIILYAISTSPALPRRSTMQA
uniref:Uncharacterized protein n=1 Tax=Cucumis melo TaxID=3656 RepID=A0A9I9E9V5_CUCME